MIWDFGGTPGSPSRLYEADLSYSGSLPLIARAGVFNSNFTLDNALGGGDSLLTEIPTIDQFVVGLVSGGGRVGAQIGTKHDRYFASLFLTGGKTGPGAASDQRAVLARVAGLAIKTDDVKLHVGASAAWLYHVPRTGDGSQTISLSNQTEFQLTVAPAAISTGSVPARGVHLAGIEAALNWSKVFLQTEAYRITIDGTGPGRAQTTSGAYFEAAYLFAGTPREWQPSEAGWHNPRPNGGFGAVEVGARYSYVDAHGLVGQGGRQGVFAAVVNWYPIEPLRFTLEGGHGRVRGSDTPRSLDFVVVRGQIGF